MKQLLTMIGIGLGSVGVCTPQAFANTWAHAKQLSEAENTVLIDISEQQMYVLRGGEALMTSGVVTGKTETPTDLNTSGRKHFRITAKIPGQYLRSPGYEAKAAAGTLDEDDYKVWVDHFLPYNRGEGLHDAFWRQSWEFGSNGHNWLAGSHGCTNMPPQAAAQLYSLVQVGTPVVVIP